MYLIFLLQYMSYVDICCTYRYIMYHLYLFGWLTFVGRIVRMSEEKIVARALFAWCNLKRPVGRSNISTRFSFLQNIEKIIPNVSKDGCFKA